MKRIGERVREKRRALGLSVEEVAARSLTNKDVIKELEWSMMLDIDVKTLQHIAFAMNSSLGELVHDFPMLDVGPGRYKIVPNEM